MISDALTPDLLRTYVIVCRLGSLSRAAEQAGRAQSALSIQMRRLEDILGKRLLRRTGRGVVPTEEGERFLAYAIRILSLGEEAVANLAERPASVPLCIGLAEEIAVTLLPAALGRLRRAWPDLRLDIVVDHSIAIAGHWHNGDLDVAVATRSAFACNAEVEWDMQLLWVCGKDYIPDPERPLEIITYAEPCLWRKKMLQALAATRCDYHVVMSSQSITAIRAGVENGLGVALMTAECVHSDRMRILTPTGRLPSPLTVQYGLYASGRQTPAMQEAIALLVQNYHVSPLAF